jgi:hypothetical protein
VAPARKIARSCKKIGRVPLYDRMTGSSKAGSDHLSNASRRSKKTKKSKREMIVSEPAFRFVPVLHAAIWKLAPFRDTARTDHLDAAKAIAGGAIGCLMAAILNIAVGAVYSSVADQVIPSGGFLLAVGCRRIILGSYVPDQRDNRARPPKYRFGYGHDDST